MELDLEAKQKLADLLAKPSSVTRSHATFLSNLIEAYPYYQPLHLLLARAKINESGSPSVLATAALYNTGQLLHQVIHQPETLVPPTLNVSFAIKAEERQKSEQIERAEDLEVFPQKNTVADGSEISDEVVENTSADAEIQDEQETFEEIEEFVALTDNYSIEDEQEIFEEIVEINSSDFAPSIAPEKQVSSSEESLTDELAIENIVATDFFAFEKSLNTEATGQYDASSTIPAVEEYDQEAEAQTVSKYDDDKLPYTFLWWLAKTRKEHEQIFQPYVTPKHSINSATTENPSELQQQYVEHIFHLQTPFTVSEEVSNVKNPKQAAHRGTDIINLFIKNDPQIRTPKAEQINTENKAKKSAEDQNDMVSETLASIYIEQMLYHKAIDTYEKLSLKFPEKSRYFADLIQSLEKKI